MKINKLVSLALSIIMIISLVSIPAWADNDIKVQINGKQLSFDVPPQLIEGRTMVPMRKIFEELGAEIKWDEPTQTVIAVKGDTQISMQINNLNITVNGKAVTLDVPPQLVGGRTLVPVRAVAEGLSAEVTWDENRQTVIITSNVLEDDEGVDDPTKSANIEEKPIKMIDLEKETDFACNIGPSINYSYANKWDKTVGTGYVPIITTVNKAYRYQRVAFVPIYGNFEMDTNGRARVTYSIKVKRPTGEEKTLQSDIIAFDGKTMPKQLIMATRIMEYMLDDTDPIGNYTFTVESKDEIGNYTTTNVFSIDVSDYKYTENKFATTDELFDFMTNYYKNPQPERITDAIVFAQENDMIKYPVLLFAFTEILGKNPYLIESTFNEIEKKFGKPTDYLKVLQDTCKTYTKMLNDEQLSYVYVQLPKTCEDDNTYGMVIGAFLASGSYDAAKILAEALAHKSSSSEKLRKYYESSLPPLKELIKSSELLYAYLLYMRDYDASASQTVKAELKSLL